MELNYWISICLDKSQKQFHACILHGLEDGSCVWSLYCRSHISQYFLLARITSHAFAGNAWWEILVFCISRFALSWPEKSFQHKGSKLTVAGSVKLSGQIWWPNGVQLLLHLPVRNLAFCFGLAPQLQQQDTFFIEGDVTAHSLLHRRMRLPHWSWQSNIDTPLRPWSPK